MKTNLSTTIPFDGFYESQWSQEIDYQAENFIEYDLEEREKDFPKELRLEAHEYSDIMWRVTNYSITHELAAKKIAEAWTQLANDELGFELGLTFEEMVSPREYNFTTDRIFMSIPRNTVAKLFRMSRAENHERLRDAIKSRFTSRDGFISHYSNRLHDWLSKPLSTWDHNEIGTLLVAMAGNIDEDCSLFYQVESLYEEWSEGVDWESFEEQVKEKREEKLEAIREIDPEYTIPEPRCPLTIEMQF